MPCRLTALTYLTTAQLRHNFLTFILLAVNKKKPHLLIQHGALENFHVIEWCTNTFVVITPESPHLEKPYSSE